MILAGVGLSTRFDLEKAAEEAASLSLQEIGGGQADLVLCFATTEFAYHYPQLFDALRRHTGTSKIVGCSAMAVITGQGEFEDSPGLAVLAISSGELKAVPFMADDASSAARAVLEASTTVVGQEGAESPLLVLLTDIFHVRPAELMEELRPKLSDIRIVGGAASGHPADKSTVQWALDRRTEQGIAGLFLAGPIRHHTVVSQACEPIGDPFIITKAEGRVIQEIGNRPAYSILQNALSVFPPEEVERVSKRVAAGILYDERKYPPKLGDYLIRSIESVDKASGAVTLLDDVRPGQTIQFQVRNPSTAREELRNGVRQIAWASLPDTPLFALYFESLGWGARMHREPDQDVKIIREGLGDIPIIGFLSNAEFAPRGRLNLVHTYSSALTVVCQQGRKRK